MGVSDSFATHVKDQLAGLGQLTMRRMFGGAALYCDGFVFAFLDEDVLYLKTDEPGRAAFVDEGMGPFSFVAKDGELIMAHAYYRAPERLLDEPDEMRTWALRAVAVSRRDAAAKAKKAPRKTKPKPAKPSRKLKPKAPAPKPKRGHKPNG
jgi:DNA transformation protein